MNDSYRLRQTLAKIQPALQGVGSWTLKVSRLAGVLAILAWAAIFSPVVARFPLGTAVAAVGAAACALPAVVLWDFGKGLRSMAELPNTLLQRARDLIGDGVGVVTDVTSARGLRGLLDLVRNFLDVRKIIGTSRELATGAFVARRFLAPPYLVAVLASVIAVPLLALIAISVTAVRAVM